MREEKRRSSTKNKKKGRGGRARTPSLLPLTTTSPPPGKTTTTPPHTTNTHNPTQTALYSCAATTCAPGYAKTADAVPDCGGRCSADRDGDARSCTNPASASATIGCAACCAPQGCSDTTTCGFGYVNTGAAPSPAGGACTACDGARCLAAGAAACQECCAPAASLFPSCAESVPPSGAQALSPGDSAWAFQGGGPAFTRFKGKQTGLCFSINLRNDCQAAPGSPACCPPAASSPAKQPAFLQVKLPSPDAVAGVSPARAATLRLIDRCKLSYGLATATVNGVKRFPRAFNVSATAVASGGGAGEDPPGTASGLLFSVPLSFSASAQSVDFCLFTTNGAGGVDEQGERVACRWERICGLDDGSVPPGGDRSLGCQFRLIGSKRAASSPCCTAPLTLTAYDGSKESVPTLGRRLLSPF